MALGVFVLLYIREPGRGVFDFMDQFKDKKVKEIEKRHTGEYEYVVNKTIDETKEI